jgi:hypothetical protein
VFKGLGHIDTVGASEQGAWLDCRDPFTGAPLAVDGRPLRLKLIGPDSEAYTRMLTETARQMGKARSLKADQIVPREEADRILAECMAPMVLEWSGFLHEENGEPLPCTRANVERLFRTVPRLRVQADEFIGSIANFKPAPGESSPPASPSE